MGNSVSTEPIKKKLIFGSVNDELHPRAGYYHNGNIIKYHTVPIVLIPGELPNTFIKLKYGYAKTNKRVFYKGAGILNANSATFSVINRDNVKVLNDNNLIKLNSVLGMDYYNNKRRIYYKGVLTE